MRYPILNKPTRRVTSPILFNLIQGLVFLFMFSCVHNIIAQTTSVQFRHLTMKEGLADGWVHDAFMDSKGIMWFATHDGLSRFDGHHFKNYKVNKQIEKSLPGAVLMGIKEDQEGTYWIACNGIGLVKFDAKEESFSSYSHDSNNKNTISNNAATSILIDADDNIWIGTFAKGLNHFDKSTETFTHYPMYNEDNLPTDEFSKNSVRFITQDPIHSDKLWVATHQGIVHFDKKTGSIINYPLARNRNPSFAVSIYADPNGIIWVATEYNGLVKFNTQTKQTTFLTNYMQTKSVLPKSENELWVATIGNGLGIYHTDTDEMEYITKENSNDYSILSNDVYGLYIDGQKRLWVRDQYLGISVSKGLGTIFQQPVNTIEVEKALIQRKKISYSSIHNELWVSSQNDPRLFIYEKKSNQYIHIKTLDLPVNEYHKILDVFSDSQSRTWILAKTLDAVLFFQYDHSSNKFQPIILSELDNIDANLQKQVNLIEDKKQRIWLSFTTGELIGLKDNTVIKRKLGKDLDDDANPEIWDLIVDEENNFWAASLLHGVYYLDINENLETNFPYRFDGGLQGWRILGIAQLQNGKIWVGTSAAGIQEIDPKKSVNQEMPIFNQHNGMPDDKINGLFVDNSGYTWVVTMRGLVKYNQETKHFRQFGPEDGLKITTLDYGFEQLANGDILIGQPNGFVSLEPSILNNNKNTNPVNISSLVVNGENFPTQPSIQYLDKLELEPEENYFSIRFSANNYDDQDQIRYRYILENYDPQWITTAPGIARADFTNVPPGKYNFKVMSSNPDGYWNENSLEFPIVIHPHWYWNIWMKLIYGLIGLGILSSIWYFQKRRWRLQHQLQIEKVEATRLKELDEIKSRFFANVSHELRTPLTLILGPISSMLKNTELNNKQFTLLKTAQQNGRDLLKLIGSILDLSKMESGKFQLEEKPELLFPMIRRIVSNFESHAERSGIRFTLQYEIPKELKFEIDKEKMEIIFNNLLSNALKFTAEGGRVSFVTKDFENVLRFTVQDTGRGIHAEDLPHVFDRFYQSRVANAPTEGGTGIGLAVSQEYLKLMNGKIWVESEFGQGSTFIVEIPRKEVLGWTENPETKTLESVEEENISMIPMHQNGNSHHESTILIVEDNYSLRNYLHTILSPHFNIMIAENGQIALNKLQQAMTNTSSKEVMPQLILSDIMMPVMDGYQLLKELRSDNSYRQIPVVMLTARADIQDKMTALRIGVDDYLLKPFEEEELLIRIKNLLKNYAERKSFVQQSAEVAATVTSDTVDSKNVVEEKTISQEDQEWLEELEKTILKYLSDSRFNMDFLGEKMFTSRRQLQRKIKKIVGLTPKEYIREIRLYEARQLLETGKTKSVKATAYEVGFTDTHYFSTQFQARFGKRPSQYLS